MLWIVALVLCVMIVAIMLGLAVWRFALRSKASKEAKDANQPVPELTFQDLVNGLALLGIALFAALGIKWALNKRSEAKEASGNGRR